MPAHIEAIWHDATAEHLNAIGLSLRCIYYPDALTKGLQVTVEHWLGRPFYN